MTSWLDNVFQARRVALEADGTNGGVLGSVTGTTWTTVKTVSPTILVQSGQSIYATIMYHAYAQVNQMNTRIACQVDGGTVTELDGSLHRMTNNIFDTITPFYIVGSKMIDPGGVVTILLQARSTGAGGTAHIRTPYHAKIEVYSEVES
jgi:hypothetical protein